MLLGLHSGTILHTNLMTDIRVARETGYEAIELYAPKLLRYLDAGYVPAEILPSLGKLRVTMINSFLDIERQEPEFRGQLRAMCERLCQIAQALGCPALQVVALSALRGQPWHEIRFKVGRSLAELAEDRRPLRRHTGSGTGHLHAAPLALPGTGGARRGRPREYWALP